MATYIILSRLDTNANIDPKDFKEKIAITVADKIHNECPGFVWKATYATIGHYDFINIVECDSIQSSLKKLQCIFVFTGIAQPKHWLLHPGMNSLICFNFLFWKLFKTTYEQKRGKGG